MSKTTRQALKLPFDESDLVAAQAYWEEHWRELTFRVGQREIKEKNLQRKRLTLQKYGFSEIFPIQVNTRGEIMSGQHRYTAAMELNIQPKIQVVRDIPADVLRELERATNKWTVRDELYSRASVGHSAAQTVLRLVEEFNANERTILIALGKTQQIDGISGMVISNEEIARARHILTNSAILQCVCTPSAIYRSRGVLIGAYIALTRIPNFDQQRFAARLQKYGREKYIPCTTVSNQLQNYISIYNYDTATHYRLPIPDRRR